LTEIMQVIPNLLADYFNLFNLGFIAYSNYR
jgi:hypothetical protein